MDFEPTVLDCERTHPKRNKLANLMHWLKKLNECPPEPLKCDYMSEWHINWEIYSVCPPILPLSANQFRIICENRILCVLLANLGHRLLDRECIVYYTILCIWPTVCYGRLWPLVSAFPHNGWELFIYQHFGSCQCVEFCMPQLPCVCGIIAYASHFIVVKSYANGKYPGLMMGKFAKGCAANVN